MGLFDKILKSGLRAVGNAVADTVVDSLKEAYSEVTNSETTSTTKTSTASVAKTGTAPVSKRASEIDDRSFDQKMQVILENAGRYEVRKNISPDELEQEAGRQLYPRSGCYASPENITYALYKDGQRILIINLWETYEIYKHKANREIRSYCDNNNIRVLDFFEYLPNEMTYMEDRIRAALV